MKFQVLIGMVLISVTSMAQNEIEALRYSWLTYQGSARSTGMGGAFSALGADMSNSVTNPAGLGRFNRTEFGISFGGQLYAADAGYNGETHTTDGFRGNISNLGIVGVKNLKPDNFNMWKSIQFGLTYNKTATYNKNVVMKGDNTNSMYAVFAEQANGTQESNLYDYYPFTSYLAYATYVLNPEFGSSDQYDHVMQYGDVRQERSIESRGGANETTFSLSANYNDKFYIGGSIGFPGIKYREDITHIETPLFDTISTDVNYTQYTYQLNTTGRGINAKAGIIFTPASYIRVGLAAHTKTRLLMQDIWSANMQAGYDNGDYYNESSPTGNYSYVLITPGRYIASVAGFIAKKGVITAEAEYVDYGKATLKADRFSGGSYSYENENAYVQQLYTGAVNIRAGAEWRIKKFLFRGGYALYGSPFYEGGSTNYVKNKPIRTSISGGFGYRNSSFYTDLGVIVTKWTEDYYMYDPNLVNVTDISNNVINFMFSLGWRY